MKFEKDTEFIEKWEGAALELGIPEEFYNVKIRIISSGKSSYSFGLILNPHRFKNYGESNEDMCNLCYVVKNAEKNDRVKIHESENYIVVPNIIPVIKSACVVIRKDIGSAEKGMYRTTNLDGLEKELNEVFGISDEFGVSLVHNSPGAGASISRHEHWHLIDYEEVYKEVGKYGYDSAKIVESSIKGVRIMPEFPFAHLIFEEDIERIVDFLNKLHSKIGSRYSNKGVPHGLVKSIKGVLVVPAKKYVEGRGTGGGDMAGHLLCRTDEEFNSADYDYCVKRLKRTLFKKDEINLERFL